MYSKVKTTTDCVRTVYAILIPWLMVFNGVVKIEQNIEQKYRKPCFALNEAFDYSIGYPHNKILVSNPMYALFNQKFYHVHNKNRIMYIS